MARTIVNLPLPYTFCDEGDYEVFSHGRLAKIKVEYRIPIPWTKLLRQFRWVSRPDDPDGFSNFSKLK